MSTSAPLIRRPAARDMYDADGLAGEHARLIRDVERRATPVLTLLDARVWPHAELGALTSFLRTTVLRQISDEEVHLFPNNAAAPPFANLGADHIRLRTLTAQLETAYAEQCSHGDLHRLVRELLDTLRRHVGDEQQVLDALPTTRAEVPAVAGLAAAEQPWVRDDGSPVHIDLDALPAHQATEVCIERLLRLQPGQMAEVHAGDELLLRAVSRWLHEFDPAHFGLHHLSSGTDHQLRVTYRRANAPAGIAYPG